jgi:hypothetical protein
MTPETNDPILTAFQESLQKKLESAFLINGVHTLSPICSELEVYDHASGDTFFARFYAISEEHRNSVKEAWSRLGDKLPSIDITHFCKSMNLIDLGDHVVHLSRFQPGMSLAEYLERIGQMVPTAAIRMTVQILHLLEKLSRAGVHHGHLTPRDIVIAADGTPYIKNQGLWKFELEVAKQLGVDSLIDPAYLSPEHFGESAVDVTAEVYNVGCLLHEMLTGQPPFQGSYKQVREDHRNKPLANPQALNSEINVGLARVLVKALSKKPEDRFSQLPDFAQTLAMLLPTAEWARYQQEAGQHEQPSAAEKEELNQQLTAAANQAKGGDLDGAMHAVSAVLRMSMGYVPAIELAEKIYRAQHQGEIKQALSHAKTSVENQQVNEALGEIHKLVAMDPRNQKARKLRHDLLEALQREKPDLRQFVPVKEYMARAAVAKTLEHLPLAELLWTQVWLATPGDDSIDLDQLNAQKQLARRELTAIYGEREVPVEQGAKAGGGFADDEIDELFAPLSEAAEARAQRETGDQKPAEPAAEMSHPNMIDPDAFDEDMTVAEAPAIPAPEPEPSASEPAAPAEEADSSPQVPVSIEDSFEAELASMEEDFDADDLDDGPSQDFRTNEVERVAPVAEEESDPFATKPLADIETVPTEPPQFPADRENLATQRVDVEMARQAGHPVSEDTAPVAEEPQPVEKPQAKAVPAPKSAAQQPKESAPVPDLPTPPPKAEPQVVAEPPPEKAAPPKSKMGLFIGLGAVAAIVLVVVGVMFYNASVRKAEFEKAARAAYQQASTLESSGDLERALTAWETMQNDFPGFSDVNERQSALEQRIIERRNTLDRYLDRTRKLISEGTLLGNGNENAAAYLKMILEIDPENNEAQNMLSEIGDEQMTIARDLFVEGKAEEARQVYADLLQVSVSFKDDVFEAEVDSFIEAKIVGPKLERLDRLIRSKKWEDAKSLSDDLSDEMRNTRPLDERWDAVVADQLAKLQTAEEKKRKKDMMAHLEVLALIRPEDPAGYLTRYNELSREINQAAINQLERQVRNELKKKDYVRAGRFAFQLSKLDSENKLAESTLQEVRSTFRSKIKEQRQGNPREAIETYNQLISVYNWRSFRRERKTLQDRVDGFEKLLDQYNKQSSESYQKQIATVVKIQEQYNDFFKDPKYTKLADTKKQLEAEKQRLESLKAYVDKSRNDNSVAYTDIVKRIEGTPAFQRAVGKSYVSKTLAEFKNKVDNYSGPVTLIIRRGQNLPRVSSGFNKDPEAYAVLTVGEQSFKTSIQRNARNPVWDHTCSFTAKPGQKLNFKVFHDKGAGELLGEVTLPSVPKSGKGIEVKGKDWSIFLDVRRQR